MWRHVPPLKKLSTYITSYVIPPLSLLVEKYYYFNSMRTHVPPLKKLSSYTTYVIPPLSSLAIELEFL